MAILTWRNVDAPGGLAASAEVVGRAGSGINEALSGLASGLGQFRQAQQDQADSAALQAAGRITNSADYERALASGSMLSDAGINPNQVSSKVSQLLSSRQGDLLTADFNRAQVANQVQDNELARDKFGLERQRLEAQIQNDQRLAEVGQYDFTQRKLQDSRNEDTYQNTQAAQALAYQIANAGVDTAGARQLLESSGANDRVKAMVSNTLKLPGAGVLPSTVGGTGDFADMGADASYGHGKYARSEVPLSKGTFGQAYDFGQTLIPLTKGKIGAFVTDAEGNKVPAGTSATGAYQFIGKTMETYAKQVFGDNWREVPFNFENQSKIAEALFNDKKDGNLQAVWSSLPDSRLGAYKDMTFEQFQREVLPRESGMTLDQIRAQEATGQIADLSSRVSETTLLGETVDQGIAALGAQRLGNINIDQYNKDTEKDDPDSTKAAESAIKSYPSLKGTDLNRVTNWINEVMQSSGLTAAQSAHVVGASMVPSSTISWHPFNGAESGLVFDEDKAATVANGITSGELIGRDLVSRQAQTDRDQLTAAKSNLDAANQAMQEIRQRIANGLPVDNAVRVNVTNNMEKALKRHESLVKKLSGKDYQPTLTKSSAQVAREEQRAVAELSRAAGAGMAKPEPLATVAGVPYGASQVLARELNR